jgi:hypothetical protein
MVNPLARLTSATIAPQSNSASRLRLKKSKSLAPFSQ